MQGPLNSRLPHKEPIIFIGEMIELNETRCRFWAEFPTSPSLAMFCEASAQGSSYFPLSPDCTIGVVSSFRNVKKIAPFEERRYILAIQIKHSFNNSYLFEFEAFNPLDDSLVATGEITVFYLAA